MGPIAPTKERAQTRGEEIANSISHGIGLLAALAVSPLLIVEASRHGNAANIVGVSIFAATATLLYLASLLYHAAPPNRAKRLFRVLDHGAIFLLIAGTYTPFTLGALRGAWGWSLFGVVWGLAALGILMKATAGARRSQLSLFLYVGMGWLGIIAVRPMLLHVPVEGLLWLLAGGLAYTAGVVFYATDHRPYRHFVWHLFVLAGTACHFVAVMGYSLGSSIA